MIQVWKCDHCSHCDVDPYKLGQHENSCTFNKKNKTCYTCEYHCETGYDYSIMDCEIGRSLINNENGGKCDGWIYRYVEFERDKKLNDLGL